MAYPLILYTRGLKLKLLGGPHEDLQSNPRAASSTNGSRTLERGGQIFAEIFSRPFLGVSRKNVSISRKKCNLSPKISDDLFLNLHKFTILPFLFLPPRGAKLHCQLRLGGYVRICPPWIRHWHHQRYKSI